MVKVIEVNSGNVGDQVSMASPGTPSTVQGSIVDVPGAPPAPQSWADTLAVGANSGPVSPVLDVPLEATPGQTLFLNSTTEVRLTIGGATALNVGPNSLVGPVPSGASLIRVSGQPCRWILQNNFSMPFTGQFPGSSASGTNISLRANLAWAVGPFVSAGNMGVMGVSVGFSTASEAGSVLRAQDTVTVLITKNGSPWFTVTCAGNGSRNFWSVEGNLQSANQFAAADVIRASATWNWSSSTNPNALNVILSMGLRVGGV